MILERLIEKQPSSDVSAQFHYAKILFWLLGLMPESASIADERTVEG